MEWMILVKGGKIDIDLSADLNQITFTVRNSFIASSHPRTSGGVGLQNVTQRLRMIYGTSHTFTTHIHGDLFIASIQIKLHEMHHYRR